MTVNLEQAPFELNLAEDIDESELDVIGTRLLEQIEIDDDTRKEWMDTNRSWLKLASQVKEDKSFPWSGASNVKYPLLTVAAMQFHARALPNLINSSNPIRSRVIGKDEDGQKLARSIRVSDYMSFQILEEIEEWMDEMDRLLFILPMTGICYKKTYYSQASGKIKSEVVLPNDLIINYHAKSFERARMTHVIPMDPNELTELQNAGIYLNIDLDEPEYKKQDRNAFEDITNIRNIEGSDMESYLLYESHCLLDLDDDGYKEPYVVTLTEDGRILRIVARWDAASIQYNDKGKVLKIIPDNYFTSYIFLPDPSSAVSGLGLGSLLGPLNESVNTIVNQLIDAGTLSNLQGGFLGRGIKLRGGAMRFRPGEWKIVNSTGDDIRKSVFPMPIREPSMVLFNLLGLLIDSGERVSAVSDIMVGENPGQNQPATTTMAVLEQGLKVFTSIYKRIHRSLTKEYRLIYKLDGIYLNEDDYNTVLDPEEGSFTIQDFNTQDLDIKPASDPMIVSQAQRSVKASALLEKLAAGLPLNVTEVTKRVLEAEGQEDIPELMQTPPPQPDFETQLEMEKFSHERDMDMLDKQLDSLKIRAQAIKDETGAELNIAKAEQLGFDSNLKTRQQQLQEVQAEAEILREAIETRVKVIQANQGNKEK